MRVWVQEPRIMPTSANRDVGYISGSDSEQYEGDISGLIQDYEEPTMSDSERYEGDISGLIQDYEEPAMVGDGFFAEEERLFGPPQDGVPHSTPSDSTRSGSTLSVSDPSTSSLGKRKDAPTPSPSDSVVERPLKRAYILDEQTSRTGLPQDPGAPYIIAHCPRVTKLLEDKQISQGIRYELARLVSTGKITYYDLTEERLEALRGSNRDAAGKIGSLFTRLDDTGSLFTDSTDSAFAQELASHLPWEELDQEEKALSEDPHAGIGNNPTIPGWYGGKVEFRGRLQSQTDGTTKSFKILLDNCTLGTSCRFMRRFGSWSFLRIKIPLEIVHDPKSNLAQFFQKQFVLWGNVFRACYAKDDNVFFYWTNERYPPTSLTPGRLSFEDFIMWHNPLEEEGNAHQHMTKWASRIQLGFSNSIPGPRLLQEHLLSEPDIVSERGSDMTDGCGLSSVGIHQFLLYRLSLESMPTAFQFRLAGNKGMLLLRDEPDKEMRAWVRSSQTKIQYPKGLALDPAMLTFDILRTSHMPSPARITSEVIINLAENGVPHNVFVELLQTTIREMVKGLTTWDGPDAMFSLWTNVERAGGVLMARRAREAVGEARVRGFSDRSHEEADLEDDDAEEDGFEMGAAPRSVPWWPDQISGCPSALEETVMELLDSGFHVKSCPILRDKLKRVVTKKIENKTGNIRLELEQSCVAFAVPDPFGVLGPEEVQIKSSHRNLKTDDGLLTDIILGDILITRNPCKVGSDVRKVKAVDHPLLRNYVDVVVFSVQGPRRLIDWLAGGDYDGDKVLAMWAPTLVLPFQNANEKLGSEPPGLDHGFTRDQEKGRAFLERIGGWESSKRVQAMQVYLLGALRDASLVGKYSSMHINTIYQYGYNHPRTVKLAYKFCRVLDAPKTGWRIRPGTLSADLRKYSHSSGPQWRAMEKDKKKSGKSKDNMSNVPYLKRDYSSPWVQGKFIMDVLRDGAMKERDRLLTEMQQLFESLESEPDADLIRPWANAEAWAERGEPTFVKKKRFDLSRIAEHVKVIYNQHKDHLKNRNTGVQFTELPIEVRQDKLRAISKAFASGPQLEDLETIPDAAMLARYRASYAYKYDAERNSRFEAPGWSRFPWNVAFRELCLIKASALGPYKAVTSNFYERFRLIKRV